MSILFLQKLMNNGLIVLYCLLVMFLPTTVFGAGGEPDHQLPSVSGAACRGREAGGPLRGNMCQGLPIGLDDGELLKQVGAAAGMVSQALSDLLQHVRHYASCGEPIGRYDQATDTIMNVTENIFTSMGDAGECKKKS